MSLDKSEAVPIDTHVRQIAVRDYGYIMKSKFLTNQAYKDISNSMIYIRYTVERETYKW